MGAAAAAVYSALVCSTTFFWIREWIEGQWCSALGICHANLKWAARTFIFSNLVSTVYFHVKWSWNFVQTDISVHNAYNNFCFCVHCGDTESSTLRIFFIEKTSISKWKNPLNVHEKVPRFLISQFRFGQFRVFPTLLSVLSESDDNYCVVITIKINMRLVIWNWQMCWA